MNLSSEIVGAVRAVTKKWTKQRKAEERESSRRARRHYALISTDRETLKDAAWEVMEEAYMKASSGNTLPAHARQIMYAARGPIQERTAKPLSDQYFTQQLLPDFLNAHPEKAAEWDVVFDARGHFEEPHTNVVVPLGTIDVRAYLRKLEEATDDAQVTLGYPGPYPTSGPKNRFGAVLFIEKEGFLPLFERVKLAERYDLAIMSTKGMSVTAARLLVDRLCGTNGGVPLLVLRDFDKAGFSIVGTLQRDTRRYEFENRVRVIDLGLRLKDVEANGLESEDVHYGKSDPVSNLRENGATDAEVAFLHDEYRSGWNHHVGKRVELNAFTSGDVIKWIESKLREQGIQKVVPPRKTLDMAYRRTVEIKLLQAELEKIREPIQRCAREVKLPRALVREVHERLKENPELSWDQVVAELAGASTAKNV